MRIPRGGTGAALIRFGLPPGRTPANPSTVPNMHTHRQAGRALEQNRTPSKRVADAERAGHERVAEINRPDVLDLRRIIAGLDRLGE